MSIYIGNTEITSIIRGGVEFSKIIRNGIELWSNVETENSNLILNSEFDN